MEKAFCIFTNKNHEPHEIPSLLFPPCCPTIYGCNLQKNNNTVSPKEVPLSICPGILETLDAHWVYDDNGPYAPEYTYYCDRTIAESLEQVFKEEEDCRKTLSLNDMKIVFGEPSEITPGVHGLFNILGARLGEIVDSDKTYQTILYECVTNVQIGGQIDYCSNRTRKLYFLFEVETGELAATLLRMMGSTGWVQIKK